MVNFLVPAGTRPRFRRLVPGGTEMCGNKKVPGGGRPRVALRFTRNRLDENTIRSRKPEPLHYHSFRFVTSIDEALCQFARRTVKRRSRAVNMVDRERNGSAEFSDLYLRLLSAALDEINSSLSPRMRECNLAAHVARGVSMADVITESPCHQG
jgi:hypothetical protein